MRFMEAAETNDMRLASKNSSSSGAEAKSRGTTVDNLSLESKKLSSSSTATPRLSKSMVRVLRFIVVNAVV
ncbi:UNVERIFIED_CONTAM: hypothetical protein Sangu_1353800 [Sesamum angustifolium]|uniref:Uncharacterized protein n=1 Tax=Sesamum angustifolium TaxID=2727405 RepID=A0AAW2N4A5_9LAMI